MNDEARTNSLSNLDEYQRRRWMRSDAHLWIRPDAKLWLQPNQKRWLGPTYVERKNEIAPPSAPANRAVITELKWLAALRNILIRSLASRFGPYIWVAAEAGSWVYDHKAEINSFFDSPKSLQQLQDAANSPADGYDVHHVVERSSEARDGSEADLIDVPANRVRIPRWKHWEINRFYQTPNKDYGGLRPSEYLKGKSWEERTQVGLDALKKVGVLRQ